MQYNDTPTSNTNNTRQNGEPVILAQEFTSLQQQPQQLTNEEVLSLNFEHSPSNNSSSSSSSAPFEAATPSKRKKGKKGKGKSTSTNKVGTPAAACGATTPTTSTAAAATTAVQSQKLSYSELARLANAKEQQLKREQLQQQQSSSAVVITRMLSPAHVFDEESSCVICLNQLPEDFFLRAKIKQCGHAFCLDCINDWLTNHKSACPLCFTKAETLQCHFKESPQQQPLSSASDSDTTEPTNDSAAVEQRQSKYTFEEIPIAECNNLIRANSESQSQQTQSEQLDCLDHHYFLGEIGRLLEQTQRLTNQMRHQYHGYMSNYRIKTAKPAVYSLEWRWNVTQDVQHRLLSLQGQFRCFEPFEPIETLQMLYDLQDRISEADPANMFQVSNSNSSSAHNTTAASDDYTDDYYEYVEEEYEDDYYNDVDADPFMLASLCRTRGSGSGGLSTSNGGGCQSSKRGKAAKNKSAAARRKQTAVH